MAGWWVAMVKALEPEDPQRVGRYLLVGLLGSGGMGRVFLGRSPGGRLVAVKVIRPELAADADFRARFAREVAAARKVSGLFTAPVVDADPDGPRPWLVTAYVPGPSLADAVAGQGPLPIASVLMLGAGLAEGLEAVHAAGVVHRDLKPSNVLLAADGPRIIDFGISRAADGTALTQTSLLVGSPGFMSPEQAEGSRVGPASDVFSLGAVLVFAATGQGPFGTGPGTALLYRVVHTQPTLGGLPAQLRSLAGWCLAKDPSQRPTTSQILAGLGSPQLTGGWLPASIGQVLDGYQPQRTAASADQAPRGAAPTRALGATGEAPTGPDAVTVRAVGGPGSPAALQEAMGAGRLVRRWARGRLTWLGAAAAVTAFVAVAAMATAIAVDTSAGTARQPGSTPEKYRNASAASASPRAVVTAFFAAINAHDWARVWQLGGKNFGYPYHAMVAGFGQTSRDVITRLASNGSTVSVRFLAYQTTGAVQTWRAHYTVRNAVIVSGQQTLLTTTSPPGNREPSPAALPVAYDCQGSPQAKPTEYSLACADGGIFLSSLTWSSWSATSAQATGQLGVNNCQPDCAAGTFGYTTATVTLSDPVQGAGGPYFAHMQLTGPSVPASMESWTLGTQGPGS